VSKNLRAEVSQLPESQAEGLGNAFLLWRMAKASCATECVGGERPGGYVWMRVIFDGRESEFAVFRSPDEAIRWAADREGELIAEGWRRIF
jgi:hypothetical protein